MPDRRATDRQILMMRRRGMSVDAICAKTGLSRHAVLKRLDAAAKADAAKLPRFKT